MDFRSLVPCQIFAGAPSQQETGGTAGDRLEEYACESMARCRCGTCDLRPGDSTGSAQGQTDFPNLRIHVIVAGSTQP